MPTTADFPPCPHGGEAMRRWNEAATAYSARLFCAWRGMFISPAGNACKACVAGRWPGVALLRMELSRLTAAGRKSAAQDELVAAVQHRLVAPDEAAALSAELWPGE